jgi:hypothetical protein
MAQFPSCFFLKHFSSYSYYTHGAFLKSAVWALSGPLSEKNQKYFSFFPAREKKADTASSKKQPFTASKSCE